MRLDPAPVILYFILKFISENRSGPNFPIGFIPDHPSATSRRIKSQTWSRIHEVLENFERRHFVEKICDGVTRQSHYKITDEGVSD